ncbi:MAG: procyclic acidic repetitive family protein [Methanoregula sp.]|nr:procyclic acidic repetitive family protein [Methanoregula sp.]
MGNPYLNSDEPIILATQNIVVKSVRFEAILTNKRLILVESTKGSVQQEDIPLAAIRTVQEGENAIRDPIITLSVTDSSGALRSVILTFSQKPREHRKRECDEWVGKLKEHSAVLQQDTTRSGTPSPGHVQEGKSGRAKTSRIEIIRGDSTSIEMSSVPKKPIETSSLPAGTFCLRCGNRVPLRSEYCNLCGTKILMSGDQVDEPAPGPQPVTAPVSQPVPEPAPQVVPEPIAQPIVEPVAQLVPEPAPQPILERIVQPIVEPAGQPATESVPPQVSVPVPPVVSHKPEKTERTIDKEIHSIEPLIADSVPRTEPAPLVSPHQTPPTDGGSSVPSYQPLPPLPPLDDSPSQGPKFTAIAAIILVILAVVGGAFIYTQFLQGKTTEPAEPVTTPSITTAPIKTPTPTIQRTPTPQVTPLPSSPPQVIIPETGVWVRVSYPGTFTGLIGTAGNQRPVTNTGDQFYQIPTNDGTIAVSVQKVDGSGDLIAIEVYKDHMLVKRSATSAPRGTIDIQVDLKTAVPTMAAPTATPR